MNDLQKVQLNIFIEFDKVCKKLDIKYFADGGTLIGAIRHKGFIPWDDDMDFCMMRKDYDLFIKKAKNYLPEYLFIQTVYTDKLSWFPLLKIRDCRYTQIEKPYEKVKINHGAWIDIFPLDEVTNNTKKLKKYDKKCKVLYKRIQLKYFPKASSKRSMLKNIKLMLLYPSWKHTVYKLNNYNKKHFAKSGYFTDSWCARSDYLFDISWYSSAIEVPFENVTMLVPHKYIKVLEKEYKDWTQLPPVSERVPTHNCIVDLSMSYKDYISKKLI